MGKIIGVVSLKGGVGKTTLTAALGDAFSLRGKKVLLVDGNLSAPNLGLHFNVVDSKASLHQVLDREVKAIDAVQTLPHFDLLPAALFSTLKQSSPLKLKDRLGPLKKDYDVIVIDSSPTLGDETLGVMLASDAIVVVSTPDHPTLSNTMSAVKLAKQRGTPIVGIVLNKVYGKDFEVPLHEVEDVSDVSVMAVVPHDLAIPRALSSFQTLPTYKPRAKGSGEIHKLAALLCGEKYAVPRFRKLWGWVNPEKQEVNRQIYYQEFFK